MQKAIETTVIAACVVLAAVGQILIKVGVSHPGLVRLVDSGNWGNFILQALLSPQVVAGLLVYIGSSALWLVILARADLSLAYPFVSIGFVATALYGALVLGESVSVERVAGIGLIVLGVVLVARS